MTPPVTRPQPALPVFGPRIISPSVFMLINSTDGTYRLHVSPGLAS